MSENPPSRRAPSLVVRLPHDVNIRARQETGGELPPDAPALAWARGTDGAHCYFKTPIDLNGFNPAIRYPWRRTGDKLQLFSMPAYLLPRETFDLASGFCLIKTDISTSIIKESEARFISSHLAALSLMKCVQDAIVEECGAADLSRIGRNLKDFVGNPDMAGQWIKYASNRQTPGFPKNGFDFWKRVYALIFWNTLCKIRTPEKSGKRSGGWDADKAADQLNMYFRNRHSTLGELEQYPKWKPYTGRWLREFEVNAGLSSKAPDGRRE